MRSIRHGDETRPVAVVPFESGEPFVDSPSGGGCLRPGGLDLTDRVVGLAGLRAGARVLDAGCGTGLTVAHLVDRHGLAAVGLDASEAQVARARRARPDLDFVAGRAEDLPFSAATFDAVLAECVLSTLPDPGAALREMVRVLARDGCALLTDLYVRGADAGAAGRGLPALGRRDDVEGLLAGAGLRAQAWEDHTGALARLIWDMTGSCGEERGRPARPASPGGGRRRLGYFVCCARVSGAGATARSKGVDGAGS